MGKIVMAPAFKVKCAIEALVFHVGICNFPFQNCST